MPSADNYGLPEMFSSTNVTRVRYVNGEPQCAVYDISTDRCGWWRPEDLLFVAAPVRLARDTDQMCGGPILRVVPRLDAVSCGELRSSDLQ